LQYEADLEPGLLPIILDPGMAFGTGLHPSTQLCLLAMEEMACAGARVLDAGCGSGILSIAAARLGARSVDAFDIDPIAVTATNANAALNLLPVPIHVRVSSGPRDDSEWASGRQDERRWDVILVNILPHVIVSLLNEGLVDYLAPGGSLLLAGIIEEREPDVLAALAAHGLARRRRYRQEDWVALVAGRG
jgi:ribosomal protein L11 methyltransferase